MNTTARAVPQDEPTDQFLEDFASFFAPRLLKGRDGYRDRGVFAFVEHPRTGATRWTLLDGFDARRAIALHLRAGAEGAPVEFEDNVLLRAAGVRASRREKTRVIEFDLDGSHAAYRPDLVLTVLAQIFGPNRFQITSGSGREGRYRARAPMAEELPIEDQNELLRRILRGIKLPAKSGGLEVFPRPGTVRLPYGVGGRRSYDASLDFLGEKSPAELLREFEALTPIDLRAVASPFPRVTSMRRRQRYDGDPRRRVERRRSTPRHIRLLLRRGVNGWNQRAQALNDLARHCLYDGRTMREAIDFLTSWVRDENRLARSRDVQRNGVEWQVKRLPELVEKIYAETPELGVPNPEALSENELARIEEIARAGSRRNPEHRPSTLARFLREHLSAFKAAEHAGLPMLRYHSRKWQSNFGSKYARIREACGIFRAVTGYKSIEATKGHPEDAHAMSWVTTFGFDPPTPEPVFVPVRGSSADARHDEIESPATTVVDRHVISLRSDLLPSSNTSPMSSTIPPDCMCTFGEEHRVRQDKPSPKTTEKKRSDPPRDRRGREIPWYFLIPKWHPPKEAWIDVPLGEGKQLDRFLGLYKERETANRRRGAEQAKRTRARNKRRAELVAARESSAACPADLSGPTDD